ncbi:MAG: hypothetical protein ABI597_03295 [Gammaproteobacteria bacterium]
MNQRPKSFLVLAAKKQNNAVVKFKITERENSPNETDEEGNNVLHWAAFYCDQELFSFLWQQADIPFHLQNQNGDTFFDRALLSYRVLSPANINFVPSLVASPTVPKVFRADPRYIVSFNNLFSYFSVNNKLLAPDIELAYRMVCARLGDASSAFKVGVAIQNRPKKASEALYWFSTALRNGEEDAISYLEKMPSVPSALFALLEFYLTKHPVKANKTTINSYFKKIDKRKQDGLKLFFGFEMQKPDYVAARKYFLTKVNTRENYISAIMAVRCLEKIISAETKPTILAEIAIELMQIYMDALTFDSSNARLLVLYWLEVFSKQYEDSNDLQLALADCYMRESQQECVDVVLVVYYQQQAFSIYHTLEIDQLKQNVVKPVVQPDNEILLEFKEEKKPVYKSYFADALFKASRNLISLKQPASTAIYLDLYAKECMSFYREDLNKNSVELLGITLFSIALALQKTKKNVELYLRMSKKYGNLAAAIAYAKLLMKNDVPNYKKIITIYEKVLSAKDSNYTPDVLLALQELAKKLQDLRIEKHNKRIERLFETARCEINEKENEDKQEPNNAISKLKTEAVESVPTQLLPVVPDLSLSQSSILSVVTPEEGRVSNNGLFAQDLSVLQVSVPISVDTATPDKSEFKSMEEASTSIPGGRLS